MLARREQGERSVMLVILQDIFALACWLAAFGGFALLAVGISA